MKELLSLLPRPSHYIGTEEGSVHKDPASVRLHCALAFPDLYEVGMSYLGHKILYTILNDRDDVFAERVFAPCAESGKLLREHGGEGPKELAARLVTEARGRGSDDDRTAIVMRVEKTQF